MKRLLNYIIIAIIMPVVFIGLYLAFLVGIAKVKRRGMSFEFL